MLLFCVDILVRASLAEALHLNRYSFLDLCVIHHITELVCHIYHIISITQCLFVVRTAQTGNTMKKQQTNT